MSKTLVALLLLVGIGPLSAQIYECRDGKGGKLWTDQPCADGIVLHEGVGSAVQQAAERSDQLQQAQRAKDSAAAAERFRQNAYDAPKGASTHRSTKNVQSCDTTRRSLRIERAKSESNPERVRQLRSDERKHC